MTYGAQRNLPGKQLATSSKDSKDDGAEREDFTADWAEENQAGVTHAMDFFSGHKSANPGPIPHWIRGSYTLWMPQLEPDQDPSGEKPKHAEEDDEHDARHQTHDSQ